MSSSDDALFLDLCARLRQRIDAGETLPSEIATQALTLGALAYARRDSPPPPLPAEAVTATDTVITVSAMLRAAGLNSFDLAMWFQRGS